MKLPARYAAPAEDLLLTVEEVVEFLASALLPLPSAEREVMIDKLKQYNRTLYSLVVNRLLTKMHAIIADASEEA